MAPKIKQGPKIQIVPKWSLCLMFESTNKQHLVRIFDYASQQTLLSVTPLPLNERYNCSVPVQVYL